MIDKKEVLASLAALATEHQEKANAYNRMAAALQEDISSERPLRVKTAAEKAADRAVAEDIFRRTEELTPAYKAKHCVPQAAEACSIKTMSFQEMVDRCISLGMPYAQARREIIAELDRCLTSQEIIYMAEHLPT